jgi:hypothetical protein
MIIHSKFKDYYDGVAAQYYDKDDFRFVRKNERVEIKDLPKQKMYDYTSHRVNIYVYKDMLPDFPREVYTTWSLMSTKFNKREILSVDVERVCLFFCGKLYRYYIIEDPSYGKSVLKVISSSNKHEYCVVKKGGWHWRPDFKAVEKDDAKPFDEYASNRFVQDLFIEYNVPYFKFDQSHRTFFLNTNPCLKDISFASILDPYTTFQEIDMFIGNTLTALTDPKMPVGGDKVVAESKGFDKYSFRKDKKK